MEVKRRKVRHMAQRLHRQVTFEIGINVGEYGVEAFCVSEMGRPVGHWEKLLEVRSAIESTIAVRTRLAALAQGTLWVGLCDLFQGVPLSFEQLLAVDAGCLLIQDRVHFQLCQLDQILARVRSPPHGPLGKYAPVERELIAAADAYH
jgi:hypothetical protein